MNTSPNNPWGQSAQQPFKQWNTEKPAQRIGEVEYADSSYWETAQASIQSFVEQRNDPFESQSHYEVLLKEDTKPLQAISQQPQKRRGKKRLLLMVLCLIGLVVIIAGVLGVVLYRTLKHAPLALHTVADIPLSGGTTRFDYQSLDPQTGLLFISRSGANSVLIFDTNTNKVIDEVGGVFDGHGVVVIPDLKRVYVSAGAKNQVVAIDEYTHKIIATIPVGEGPDGLAYDPVDHKVFVSDEDGHNDAVIDVQTEKQIGLISLGGEPGNTQYDSVSHRIFVNVQTLNQLIAIDPTSDQIVGHYPLLGCEHNHGLNIDTLQRIAFIACDGNAKLLVVDMHTMKVVDTASTGARPDVLALDSSRHILYVAAESGIVSIFEELSQGVHKLKEGYVASFAHTVAVNQKTQNIYLPLENVDGKALIRVALYQP